MADSPDTRFSKKTVFIIVIGLCAVAILTTIIYTDIANISSIVAKYTDIGTRVYFLNQYLTSISGDRNSSSHVTAATTEKRRRISTQPAADDDFSTTTMTFNTTLVVHCKESPFIECRPPKLNVTNNKFWKILYLKIPRRFSEAELDVSSCHYNQCQISYNMNQSEADLTYVYGVHLHDTLKPPPQIKDKLYVIGLWESPIYAGSSFVKDSRSVWNKVFNIIMTYRVEADIFAPYKTLKFRPRPVNDRPDYYAIAKNKTKTVLWLVSHCKTQSKREQYVAQMKKYVDVDIFGSCGKPCSKDKCQNLFSNYKFYLAFENSLCTDYVTEKFFKMFEPETYVIPVVRGGANYDKYFANFTYINTAHFKTAKDLALYLKHLASDLKTYSKYLEYKDLYVAKNEADRQRCFLCEYLHTHTFEKPKLYNLKSWLVDGQCFSPKDI